MSNIIHIKHMYFNKVINSKRILLIEPDYKATYPPLGLMKLSTFHKRAGDEVHFLKGTSSGVRDQHWDLIYISTLFTFQWKKTLDTIQFYKNNKSKAPIIVGGVLASLLKNEIEEITGVEVHFGLYDEIDRLTPDYSLIEDIKEYSLHDASIGYMTRGCINKCKFCAVPKIEPNFINYIPLENQLSKDKKDLVLFDNNVLASDEFPRIVRDLIGNNFNKGARVGKRQRFVDFNQGIDARLINDENMALLSSLALRPLRIAFDDIKLENIYAKAVMLAKRYGITHLSNYILYNYLDTPEDFYRRLRINVELNEQHGLSIFSFPMKYVPLDSFDRKYVGINWTPQQLRGIQCILHATHGVVGPKLKFFNAAFGNHEDEFKYIIEQPEESIFYRNNLLPYDEYINRLNISTCV
ncbi:cobalamin-binding domain-containing protein [Dehalococcoides mccartyi]|uniref:Cobalamin-binding domain-containing protein n=1 Tax=Dehalococcoides mccartyi TaxID=61435 RepID=A0A142VA25_9CHLR|nr:cobalamin-binding domain-containing protein [Dehalococcoides mccartyi]AGG07943.1 cobalamin-binding domain-containing protein [Dehalococcoides mccartyi BTF08]AMU86638.1 cobalamin-binding domain-containing protein [Dehalococcoides mccartyi]